LVSLILLDENVLKPLIISDKECGDFVVGTGFQPVPTGTGRTLFIITIP